MSLRLPERSSATTRNPSRRGRLSLLAMLGIGLIVLTGCGTDSEFERFAMPEPATVEGEHTLGLWQGAWIAALVTGVVVWGLIFYAIWKFRRRSDDEIPVQTRYNLPLEIFYTIFPIIMVIVFFDHTIRVQNLVLNDEDVVPDQTVYVVGQKWSWTFNYPEAVEGAERLRVRHGFEHPDPGAPGRPDHALRAAQPRRHPRLRRPRLPHQDGRHARPEELLPGHAQDRGLVRRQVLRALWGSTTRGCSSVCTSSPRPSTPSTSASSTTQASRPPTPICGGNFAETQVGLETEEIEEVCQ